MKNNITIYPDDVQLRFIKREAKEHGRSMSNYILYLLEKKRNWSKLCQK